MTAGPSSEHSSAAGALPGSSSMHGVIAGAAIIFATVFVASLFGIMTRPVGSLAAIWPANALLLGVMVRNPRLATLPSWCAAFAAYVAADLLTGGDLSVTLWLTAANMIGVLAGVILFRKLTDADRSLMRPLSVLYLLAISAAAAMAAAVSGGGAAKIVFGRDFMAGLEFWFVTELVNNMIVLPAILTWPSVSFRHHLAWPATVDPAAILPIGALMVSGIAAVAVGGPGAIVFSVPALIWCALTYPTFTTAVITATYCAGMLMAASTGLISLPMSSDTISSVSSLRLGIALTAIGPLTVSSINSARERLTARMRYAAEHDTLTAVLSRLGFLERSRAVIARMQELRSPTALLMLDIDHFKSVNDSHGHAAGDAVLVEFAGRIAAILAKDSVFGRLGGEEFAIILPAVGNAQALIIAERIRAAVASEPIATPEGPIRISTSIGVATSEGEAEASLDRMLAKADHALYEAKSRGRNRVLAAA